MKKLFRMKHEPCRGTCYEYDDVLKISQMSPEDQDHIITRMSKIHNLICGDEKFALGLDLDESAGLIIGHMRHAEGMDLVSSANLLGAVNALCDLAEEILKEQNPQTNLAACDHGSTDTLKEFWLRHAA